ncbi:hypothetical protein J2I47_25760 [Fibrella sp. HMF5335]|uniref:Outer membrane protein beta-barrel domain-containing protein n=1 Tax=Fibrella rubiginis TaxID=2817060 RepID=A0A939GP02_9BACT|nr:hypothetical protein [Fibrella rubiginis]MBO0939978.1 hypothetical protein [Fibrella rubiginis]
MKHTFLFSLSLFSFVHAEAQTGRGQSITSGDVGIAYTWGSITGTATSQPFATNGYNTSLTVAFNRGVFVRDSWLLGYTIGFGRTWQGNTTQYSQRTQSDAVVRGSSGSVAGFVRRYWPVADRLFVYAGGGLGVSYGRNKSEQKSVMAPSQELTVTAASNQENWSADPSVQAGLLYAVSDRFGVEAGIRSNGLPIGASTASIGVNILSGRGGGAQAEAITAFQTQAGRWLLGASLSAFGNTAQYGGANAQQNNTRYSTGSVGLSAGRFVRNNTAIGLALRASLTATDNNLSAPATNYYTTYVIAPFVRAYKGQNRLRPFAEGGVEFSSTIQSVDRRVDQQQIGAQGSVGIAYMLGQRFIVQTTLATLYGRYLWYPKQADNVKSNMYTVGLTGSTGSNLAVAYSF